MPWASCQIRKIAGCACAGLPGTFSPPRVSDPIMHHGTCVTHVPWCMPGSLSSGFLWSWWRKKRSRHSRRMRNAQFYISGKRSMGHRAWPLWEYEPTNNQETNGMRTSPFLSNIVWWLQLYLWCIIRDPTITVVSARCELIARSLFGARISVVTVVM